MKASEIKEAAKNYWYKESDTYKTRGRMTKDCFEAGARWYAEQTKHFMDEAEYYDDEEMLEKVYALCQIEEGK